jgi:hypothetical protein
VPEPAEKSPAEVDATLDGIEQRQEERTKKSPRPMDPALRATAKLDRLLADMDPAVRCWAVAFIQQKYGAKTP